jgi:hypothetical protein
MWKIAIGIISFTAWVQAQRIQDLLLPKPQHIAGVVMDSESQPVAEARIEHVGDLRQAHQTDSRGKFELDTRAPRIDPKSRISEPVGTDPRRNRAADHASETQRNPIVPDVPEDRTVLRN